MYNEEISSTLPAHCFVFSNPPLPPLPPLRDLNSFFEPHLYNRCTFLRLERPEIFLDDRAAMQASLLKLTPEPGHFFHILIGAGSVFLVRRMECSETRCNTKIS